MDIKKYFLSSKGFFSLLLAAVSIIVIYLISNNMKSSFNVNINVIDDDQTIKTPVTPLVQDKVTKNNEKIDKTKNEDSLKLDTIKSRIAPREPVSLTRQNIMDNLFKNGEKIVAKLPGARNIIQYLKNNLVLAIPSGDTLKPLDSTITKPLKLVIIMRGDSLTSAGWKQAANQENPGINYFPLPNNCLIVRDYSAINEIIQGLALIHQGYKAMVLAPRSYRQEMFDCQKEQEAHEISNKILTVFGGKVYSRFLNQETNRLKDKIDSLNAKDSLHYGIGKFWPHRIDYNDELMNIFKAKTNLEKDLLGKYFWVHATFALLEKEMTGEDKIKEKKIAFMHYLYYTK